jgi:hypothetical protein
VVSLDIDACAVWRAAKRVPLPPGGDAVAPPRVLVDLGAAQSRVVIGVGNAIQFVKAIHATAESSDALAREILQCVRYRAATFHGPPPTRIELVGGWANDAQVRSVLASTLRLAVTPADLFVGVDVSAIPQCDPASLGEWAIALGLALKGARAAPTLSAVGETPPPPAAVMAAGGAS